MKIALFTETYINCYSGVKTHIKTLKDGLEKLGHEVLIVCALPKTKKHFIKDGVLCCPSISLKKIYNYGVAKPISPSRYKFIKNFKPDVIHIHTEFGVGFSGAYAAKMLKIPYVYTMHTMYDEYLYYIAPKKLINIAKKTAHFYVKQLAQRAAVIVGPSVKIRDFLKGCGVEKEVEIIPNSVELSLFDEENLNYLKKEEIKKNLSLKEEDVVGCFCGRLGKEKNVDVLLKYWSELLKKDKKFKLLIFGDGPYKKEFENLAANLNITDNVIFLGKVEHNSLPEYYAVCDFYITCSLSEVHSISNLEAMASGLFVFQNYDELNKDQIIENVNGVTFKNVNEMVEKILDYGRKSKEEKLLLRQSTRESVLKHGEEELGRKMVKIYEKAIIIQANKKKKKNFLFSRMKISK